MANDEWDSVFGNATQNGRADLDAVINPGKYTSNINNPLAKKLLTAYSALKAGVALPRMAGTAGDIGAIVAGAAGGMQAGQEYDVNNLPISQLSPSLAEQFPAAANLTLPQFQQMKDLFKSQQPPVSESTWAVFANKYPGVTREGLTEKSALELMKEAGRTERSAGVKITDKDPMLPEYSKTLGVPAESLIGQDSAKVLSMYGRIKTRQERVQYSAPQPILNESGDVIGYYQTSSQGKLASTPMPLAAGASQKEKDLGAVSNIMSDLFNTAKGFEPESGPVQRVFGGLNVVKAKLGMDAEKKAYLDSIDSFLGNLAREYSGEKGVLTDQDVGRIKSAMPTLYDTDEELDFKFKQIQRVIANRLSAIEGGRLMVPGVSQQSKPFPAPKRGGSKEVSAW